MKVYIVIGGYDNDGYVDYTIRVFSVIEDALVYSELLTGEGILDMFDLLCCYDYSKIIEREIE